MGDRALNEREIVALIREIASGSHPGVKVPIGDDSAVFRFPSRDVLLTVDSLYEGVHFDLETYSLSDVGWKAAAAGISDIAAMGGEPSCSLLSLGFSGAPSSTEVVELVGGFREMAVLNGCELVGGDVCRSAGGLAITVTVAGTVPGEGRPVLRGGAEDGDLVGVTGCAGDSAAGLYILEGGDDKAREMYPGLVSAHLRPKPRVLAGRLIASLGASAMEDVSDGIAPDIRNICRESGLGCEIQADLIPLSVELSELAEGASVDPLRWALAGGEDYELLFTAPPGRFERILDSLGPTEISASRIGVMMPAGEGCRLLKAGGERVDLEGLGYEHFA